MGSFQLALAMFTRTTSRIPGPYQKQGPAAPHEKPCVTGSVVSVDFLIPY